MNTMKVIFARNNKPISLLIRLVTWSRWSHCAVVDGNFVIEARGGCGVVITPLTEFKKRYTDYAFADMPVIDSESEAVARAAAESRCHQVKLHLFKRGFKHAYSNIYKIPSIR